MRGRFDDKHVLVTGGGRGLGFEIAMRFGLEGARLSIIEYNGGLLEEARDKPERAGIEINPCLADVSKPEHPRQRRLPRLPGAADVNGD